MQMDYNEVYRYLRCPAPDAALSLRVDRALERLRAVARPRFVWAAYPLRREHGAVWVGELCMQSAQLARRLLPCAQAALLAATLGLEVDRELARAQLRGAGEAWVLQGCATAYLEAYLDACQRQMERESGQRTLSRFSPGYGDLSLTVQKQLLERLNAKQRLGIGLTDGLMMTPVKSVTAVVGLAGPGAAEAADQCAACGKLDCVYRKD